MPLRILKKDKARNDQAKQQSAMAQKQETPKPQNLNSKGSEKANEPTSPSARRDERKAEQREQRIKLKEYGMKKGGLSAGQKKIASKAPPYNEIGGNDFAVLRAEKAKGRGMGLQDEKVKPGKMMKAKKGTFAGYSKVFETAAKAGEKNTGTSTIVGVKPNPKKSVAKSKRVTYKSMDEMRQKTLGYKPGESTEAFKKRKANEAFAKRAASATGVRGKIALGVAAAGVGAYNYLKSKMKKKKESKDTVKDGSKVAASKVSPRMGGGMMKVPGYSSGTTDPIKTFGPNTRRPPERRQKRVAQQPRRSVGKRAGVGALGGAGNKKDSLAMSQYKTYKSEVESDFSKLKRISKEVKGASPNIQKNVEKKFKPFLDTYGTDSRIKASRRDATKTYMMGGGMMNKPMGYKSGKSIKVKCKLGKNKPTKMY